MRTCSRRTPPTRWSRRLVGILTFVVIGPTPALAQEYTRSQTKPWAREAIAQEFPQAKRVRWDCDSETPEACGAVAHMRNRKFVLSIAFKLTETQILYTVWGTGKAKERRAQKVYREGEIAPPPGYSRSVPVPRGATGSLYGWDMTVVATDPDATPEVMAENQFNDPPQQGSRFYMVTVRVTRTAAPPESFSRGRLSAAGVLGVEYRTFDDPNCGVIPDPLTSNEIFVGGTAQGNVCWHIRHEDASTLSMFDRGDYLNESWTWFALT